MKKSKYRIKKFDVVNDVWILQENKFLFFWVSIGVGGKTKLEDTIKSLENIDSIL